jgi:transcriptional regulator with XRE-family HTH domain
MGNVSTGDDLQEFLTSMRARLTPEQVGLQSYGRRRVPGLRREEVAMLAQVSMEYYSRLERGNLGGVSGTILESLVQALRLDDVEARHLRDLIRASENTVRPRRQRTPQQRVRPTVQRMLDAMTDPPRPSRTAGSTLSRPTGWARHFTPLNSTPRYCRRTRHGSSSSTPAEGTSPRTGTARRMNASPCSAPQPAATRMTARCRGLVGELSTRSDEFRMLVGAHNVHQHKSGSKRIRLPAVGDLTLDFKVMELVADPGLTIITLIAEPGSPSQDDLQLLSSWAATPENTEAAAAKETT